MAQTLLWYDLETFGTHPQWDRIAQFAAIRTNNKFEQVGTEENFYCRLSPDYLPHPEACLVSRITPQEVNERGLPERNFTARVHALVSEPGTCVVGFNNLRFDDEFLRALLYRNFFDPYKREYENGNTRWDIMDLVRMARDLRPEGIEWPADEEGKPLFKLELLTKANGLSHENAHDALSDVWATIALAKLIHKKQEKLFRYYFKLRKKEEVRSLLNLQDPKPVVHTSGMFTSVPGCTTLVYPVSAHPTNPNVIITYDLRQDPSDWIDADVEEIRYRVFTRREELDPETRIPLKGVHVNRVPAIAPLNTLPGDRAKILGIDIGTCLRHADILKSRTDLIQKVRSVYTEAERHEPRDPELQIYSGDFFPDEDREVFSVIRNSAPEELLTGRFEMHDPRGPELLWRYIGRNYPEHLSEGDRARWKSFCASRLLTPEPKGALDISTYLRDVRNRLSRVDTPAADKKILKKLLDYGEELERNILA
ncbi:MAG: exodeoxyribonuclease I [Spirochaetales bacterium]|nr:exodeoxyribonuclease I [Spirochaetales bacterium]